MITEELKHTLDSLPSEIPEQAREIEYYLNFLEKPETLYTFTENTINFFKSLIK